MKSPIFKNSNLFVTLMFVLALTASCNRKSASKCGPCPAIAQVAPNITFKVVDKTTGDNLFYGSKALYKTSELKMHHIVNGKPDTAFLRVDSLNQAFHLYVPPAHRIDTVTMQIATKPQDVLVFNTVVTGGCCPFLRLSNVLYNGAVVYTAGSGANIVLLPK